MRKGILNKRSKIQGTRPQTTQGLNGNGVTRDPHSDLLQYAQPIAQIGLDGTIQVSTPAFRDACKQLLAADASRVSPDVWQTVSLELATQPTGVSRQIKLAERTIQCVFHRPDAGETTVCIAEDVTGLVAALETARHAKEKLEDIGRLVSDWLWECDTDLNLTYISARVTDNLRVHPLELRGKNLLDLCTFAPSQNDPVQLFQNRCPFRDEEVQIVGGDGDSRMFRLSALPIFDNAGVFLGYRGTAADVTEARRREADLLRAKEEAEVANRTKTEFLANMSHELRTPLNAIIGFAEVMREGVFGRLSVRYAEYVNDIIESARHLLNIINEILDVSKSEVGKLDLHESTFDPSRVVQTTIRLVGERAHQAGVSLHTDDLARTPLVQADEQKTKQIMLNLLSNAVKFTPRNGRVSVTMEQDGEGLWLRVADTGIGMTADEVELAMTPFGQVESSFSRSHEGTGLGLPLAKAMAELHGGRLTVESTPGKGTTVSFNLPRSRLAEGEVARAAG